MGLRKEQAQGACSSQVAAHVQCSHGGGVSGCFLKGAVYEALLAGVDGKQGEGSEGDSQQCRLHDAHKRRCLWGTTRAADCGCGTGLNGVVVVIIVVVNVGRMYMVVGGD